VDADVILARAYPSEGAADETQAFADTLAAGGWAADTGATVLLTQSDQLSTATAAHLADNRAARLWMVDGTAALAESVAAEVAALVDTATRVEGPTRFDTAAAIAAARGFDEDSPASRVILIEGQAATAWA